MKPLIRIALALPLALSACAGQGGSTPSQTPLASELSMKTGEDTPAVSGAALGNLDGGGDQKSLFRLAHDGLQEFNNDMRALLDRVHDIAENEKPVISDDNRRVWVVTDGDAVLRLVIEKAKLGEINYPPEDEMPGPDAVRGGLPPLPPDTEAFRFALEVKKASEDDGAFRLAAKGHVVRIEKEPLGVGGLVVYRGRILEVMPNLVARREQVAVLFDHRGDVRREAVALHVQDSLGHDERAAWVYRQLSDRAGALKLVHFGDLPQTPVSGNQPELVVLVEEWLRTDQGFVARAHARISAGDLGPDAINVIECEDAIDHIGFRAVILPDGSLFQPGSGGDPKACGPFDVDHQPPPPDGEQVPYCVN